MTHSTSSTTISLITNNQNINQIDINQTPKISNTLINNNTPSGSFNRNNSNSNLLNVNSSSALNANNSITETDDTCTITSALKHYLIRLKEPLMTFSYNQQFLNACSRFFFKNKNIKTFV
jgi:hypothetical protein